VKLKSGEVVVDRYQSHLSESVRPHLPAALARVVSGGRQYIIEEVDFSHQIGETICVSTGPTDQIVYAKRPKRFGLTRFVKNRAPESCSSVVVVLKAGGRGEYVLITAFIGRRPEPEPWDIKNFSQQINPREAERLAREFWSSHALVWGCEEIIPGTETGRCPWPEVSND
jgi:hypothetical protein